MVGATTNPVGQIERRGNSGQHTDKANFKPSKPAVPPRPATSAGAVAKRRQIFEDAAAKNTGNGRTGPGSNSRENSPVRPPRPNHDARKQQASVGGPAGRVNYSRTDSLDSGFDEPENNLNLKQVEAENSPPPKPPRVGAGERKKVAEKALREFEQAMKNGDGASILPKLGLRTDTALYREMFWQAYSADGLDSFELFAALGEDAVNGKYNGSQPPKYPPPPVPTVSRDNGLEGPFREMHYMSVDVGEPRKPFGAARMFKVDPVYASIDELGLHDASDSESSVSRRGSMMSNDTALSSRSVVFAEVSSRSNRNEDIYAEIRKGPAARLVNQHENTNTPAPPKPSRPAPPPPIPPRNFERNADSGGSIPGASATRPKPSRPAPPPPVPPRDFERPADSRGATPETSGPRPTPSRPALKPPTRNGRIEQPGSANTSGRSSGVEGNGQADSPRIAGKKISKFALLFDKLRDATGGKVKIQSGDPERVKEMKRQLRAGKPDTGKLVAAAVADLGNMRKNMMIAQMKGKPKDTDVIRMFTTAMPKDRSFAKQIVQLAKGKIGAELQKELEYQAKSGSLNSDRLTLAGSADRLAARREAARST